jgi:hypothetical protein
MALDWAMRFGFERVRRTRAIAALGGCVLLLALAGCGGDGEQSSESGTAADTSTPEGTVEGFYQAILDGNPGDACDLLTQEGDQTRLLLPGLDSWVPPGTVRGPLEPQPCEDALADPPPDAITAITGLVTTIETKEESGANATVEVTSEGALVPSGILLVKEGEEWKINEPSLGSANR